MKRRILLAGAVAITMVVLLHFAPVKAQSSIAAANCEEATVGPAILSAINATPQIKLVTVPAGHCTWTSTAYIPQGWPGGVVQGAGDTQTFIDTTGLGIGGSGNAEQAVINTASNSLRITGFHFICARIDLAGSGWRTDHNTFECHQHDYQVWGTGVKAEATNALNQKTADLNGLVDNNHFIDQRTLNFGYQSSSLGETDGSTWWSRPLDLGGPNAMYIEDNTFVFESFENVIDCQSAGSFVFRFNTVAESYMEAHPANGGARGCRKWEAYNNTFTQSALQVDAAINFRGGTGVVFNNTFTGTFGNGHGQLTITRATTNVPFLGACNGTNPWDGNQDSTGWPCIDQIGRGGDNTGPFNGTPPPYSPQPQSSEPAYFWNNTMNGSQMIISPYDAPTAARLMLNRDYFVSASTVKPGYTSYIHPHPLQGVVTSSPRPATGVIVTP